MLLFLVIVLFVPQGDLLLLFLPQPLAFRVTRLRRRVLRGSRVYRTFHSAAKVNKTVAKTVSATAATPCVIRQRRETFASSLIFPAVSRIRSSVDRFTESSNLLIEVCVLSVKRSALEANRSLRLPACCANTSASV